MSSPKRDETEFRTASGATPLDVEASLVDEEPQRGSPEWVAWVLAQRERDRRKDYREG